MGRTGRRSGSIANTTFFIEKESKLLQTIAIVELARTKWVEDVKTNKKVWHILLHQIMAMCLERGAVTPAMLWEQLHKAYCFSEITREQFDQFITFLLSKDFLHDDGGMYSMGLNAEKAFGKKNFMEMYSVFSTPLEFEVINLSGDVIGTIQWDFLEKLLEESSAFYLAGRSWLVERIEWKKKCVKVVPAPAGKIPKWSGISPNFLSYKLCRKMRDIIVSTDEYPYLDFQAKELLEAIREDQQDYLSDEFAPIEHDDKGMIWWTWAGGNINNTIRTVLKIELGIDIQVSNECIKVKSDTLIIHKLREVIKKISEPTYWDSLELLREIYSMVPNYHLSKFQPYLPEDLKLKLVADKVFDFEGTIDFLKIIRHDIKSDC
ncbi:hypothetical protein LFREDSHE_04300 [Shewanella baltica]